MRHPRLAAPSALLLVLLGGRAHAEPFDVRGSGSGQAGPAPPAPGPRPYPTLLWVAAQAIPSPQWRISGGVVQPGARWQVTPLLWAFGADPRVSPFRVLVVEPLVRHAGSIELFGSPEYLDAGGSFAESWLARVGLRAYFPLVYRGETLSCSLGGSVFDFRERAGAAFEGGVYTLFGLLGVQATYTPARHLRGTTLGLSVRVF